MNFCTISFGLVWFSFSSEKKMRVEKDENDKNNEYLCARITYFYIKKSYMIDQQDANLIRLKQRVEETVGCQMKTPRNFDYLSRQVQELTHHSLSVSTLKRIWGYTQSKWGVSNFSFDVLSNMVGYASWQAFCEEGQQAESAEASSHNVVVRRLNSRSLTKGDVVELRWQPDRRVVLEYLGVELFRVIESENSKLQVGDQFQASLFVDVQPLLLCCLQREGMPPVDYQCGLRGGIHWQIIHKDEAQS